MPYSYKIVSSSYYNDVNYPHRSCSSSPTHSPIHQSGARSYAICHEEESDAQPLDLSLRTNSHEPVAKKPRLDHNFPEQVDYPGTYPCSNGGSLKHRTSPYSHYSTRTRSPYHTSSPSAPHESPYVQNHSPSPAYYSGNFITAPYHIPRSPPSMLSTSPPPYALTPSSDNIHRTGSDAYSLSSYGDDTQRPLIHNYGPCFKDAEYDEASRKNVEKATFQDLDGGLRFIYRTFEPDSINGKQPSTGHLEEGKNKEESELSRLLAPGRPPEIRGVPTYEHRSTTPGTKISSCSVQSDQVSKTLFPTKDSYQAQSVSSTNQAPVVTSSPVQCSSTVQSQPRLALSPPVAPVSGTGLTLGSAAPCNKENAPKIKSKKSLLLDRTAGLYHTVKRPGDGTVAKPYEVFVAPEVFAAPAEEEGKDPPPKISLLDFWISKILMERSEEAPKKPCSVDYIQRTDGQSKIRISLVDLIEMQVEHSLKA